MPLLIIKVRIVPTFQGLHFASGVQAVNAFAFLFVCIVMEPFGCVMEYCTGKAIPFQVKSLTAAKQSMFEGRLRFKIGQVQ